MMMLTDIIADLEKKLKRDRFVHTRGVAEVSVRLAKLYGVDEQEAELAAWLHDCARVYPTGAFIEECVRRDIPVAEIDRQSPILLHAPLGVYLAKHVYGVENNAVLDAIAYHTVGREQMTTLERIVYLADMIEPSRDYDGVELLRELAEEDLARAMVAAFDQSIAHVIHGRGLLHPNTILARNELLMNER